MFNSSYVPLLFVLYLLLMLCSVFVCWWSVCCGLLFYLVGFICLVWGFAFMICVVGFRFASFAALG